MIGLLPLLVFGADPLEKAFTPAERTVLAAPSEVILRTMEAGFERPRPRDDSLSDPKPKPGKRRVLHGRAAIDAVAALRNGLKLPATPMKCFNPRLQMTAVRGKSEVTMLICFECQQIRTSGGTLPFSTRAAPQFERLLK